VSVVRIDPADPRWDDYVRAQPHARPYHLGPWAAVLRGAYGFRPEYLALVDGEAVRGVLPLMGNRGLAGRRLRSLPALPAAGPLADSPEGERELLAAARERAAASGATLTVRTRSPALEIDGLRRRPMYASFVLALPDDPDELRARWRRQSSNLHRSIERARREGVSVREARGGDVRAFYDLYVELMRVKRVLPRPLRQLELDLEMLGARDAAHLWVAVHGGRVVAGALFHVAGETIDLLWSASSRDALRVRPNHAVYWHAIRWSIERGLRRFDLGEARPRTSLESFKQQWGARPEPEFRYDHGRGARAPVADVLRVTVAPGVREARGSRVRTAVWTRIPPAGLRAAGAVGYRLL